MQNFIKEIDLITKSLKKLFPLNRSLTGKGNLQTLEYIKKCFLPNLQIKKVKSGTKVFDWNIPQEWSVKDAYIKNSKGKKIVDFYKNNLHLVNYSAPFTGILSKEELIKKLHFMEDFPNRIPYKTSYYNIDWGFCVEYNLINSKDFIGPFEVCIDTEFKNDGNLIYGEIYKEGKSKKEILLSTYCCHPSMANDNLSGLITACMLFSFISKHDNDLSYRLLIAPETIGAIAFLKQANTKNIIGGTIFSCTAGPDKLSIKEGFNSQHWLNKLTHKVLKNYTNDNYITYPFTPDGSDERQYSLPAHRIVTPSVHKSKYYEYDEYHTSADNLDFISKEDLMHTLGFYKEWYREVDNHKYLAPLVSNQNAKNPIAREDACFPKTIISECEYQLGKRDLYPILR